MKKRPHAHILDASGERALRALLPTEWVIREYKPDYGLDFAVEVFEETSTGDGEDEVVSLAEHFFIQLKSRSKIEKLDRSVFPRWNVEKQALQIDRSASTTISVVTIQLQTSDLELAFSAGAATPILLVVCEPSNGEAYWVCLNDYIEKILTVENPDWRDQGSHSIFLPTWNRLDGTPPSLMPLRLFARRAKLYAAFNRFRYQRHELDYALERAERAPWEDVRAELLPLLRRFATIVLGYEFWDTTRTWPAVELVYGRVRRVAAHLESINDGLDLEAIYAEQLKGRDDWPELGTFLLFSEIRTTWDQLANLGNVFEEICREWFLPTYLGSLSEQHSIKAE